MAPGLSEPQNLTARRDALKRIATALAGAAVQAVWAGCGDKGNPVTPYSSTTAYSSGYGSYGSAYTSYSSTYVSYGSGYTSYSSTYSSYGSYASYTSYASYNSYTSAYASYTSAYASYNSAYSSYGSYGSYGSYASYSSYTSYTSYRSYGSYSSLTCYSSLFVPGYYSQYCSGWDYFSLSCDPQGYCTMWPKYTRYCSSRYDSYAYYSCR